MGVTGCDDEGKEIQLPACQKLAQQEQISPGQDFIYNTPEGKIKDEGSELEKEPKLVDVKETVNDFEDKKLTEKNPCFWTNRREKVGKTKKKAKNKESKILSDYSEY